MASACSPLIVRPALDPSEIDREREVIVEEIRGYLDDPSEYAQILFQQAMFGSSALGREICGEESDVRGLPADGIREFWSSTYRPANAVGWDREASTDHSHEDGARAVDAVPLTPQDPRTTPHRRVPHPTDQRQRQKTAKHEIACGCREPCHAS